MLIETTTGGKTADRQDTPTPPSIYRGFVSDLTKPASIPKRSSTLVRATAT